MKFEAAIGEYGGQRKAARALNMPYNKFVWELQKEREGSGSVGMRDAGARAEKPLIELPRFPRKHPDTEDILNRLERDSRRRDKRMQAERWFRVQINDPKPIGVLWFGDPHIGVLCDITRLRRDVTYCATVPGLYGANIGDVSDNWVGSLMRIAAEQDISRRTERQLAKWFLSEAGITWLVWLFGNHDEWNDGSEVLRLMDIHNRVPMFDWSAKFEMVWPSGRKVRVHAAHDFPGHSMWNVNHGPSRAPRMLGDGADLYVCGHKHTWGIQQFEMPESGKAPLSIRTRGYKRHDPHARRLGYPDDRHGCGILTIFNPECEGPGKVLAFADVDQGVRVLQALRGEYVVPERTSRKRVVKTQKRRHEA